MKIRYLIRKYTTKSFSLLTETAFHEAGHIWFSYFADFKVDKVEISHINIGNGKATINYGDVEDVVKALFDLNHTAKTFNNLPIDKKSKFQSTSYKLINSLIGGPLTEARYKALKEKRRDADVIIEHSDYKMSMTIEESMNNILNNQGQPTKPNFTQKQVEEIGGIISLKEVWNVITELALAILNKKNYTLDSTEIELILTQKGFYTFVDNLPATNSHLVRSEF